MNKAIRELILAAKESCTCWYMPSAYPGYLTTTKNGQCPACEHRAKAIAVVEKAMGEEQIAVAYKTKPSGDEWPYALSVREPGLYAISRLPDLESEPKGSTRETIIRVTGHPLGAEDEWLLLDSSDGSYGASITNECLPPSLRGCGRYVVRFEPEPEKPKVRPWTWTFGAPDRYGRNWLCPHCKHFQGELGEKCQNCGVPFGEPRELPSEDC